MVDTKALFKTFGTGADVIGQIATDKAVNARRQKQRSYSLFDITDGQLIEEYAIGPDKIVPHQLNRIPKGAFILYSSQYPAIVVDKTAEAVALGITYPATVTLWVV